MENFIRRHEILLLFKHELGRFRVKHLSFLIYDWFKIKAVNGVDVNRSLVVTIDRP